MPLIDLKALLENNQINSKHFDLEHLGIEARTFKKNIHRVQMKNQEVDLAPIFTQSQVGGDSIK